MVKNLKMVRFRVVFTGLFLLLNKICFASTADFKISPVYESYYGFNPKYTCDETDKIFYNINGGLRVLCNATIITQDSMTDILRVGWFEKKVDGTYLDLTCTEDCEGVWTPGNKSLLISRAASTPDMAGREFVCRATENGYVQDSTAQVMTLAYIEPFAILAKKLHSDEESTVVITCPKPGGAPEPEISWTHNDSLIDLVSDSRVRKISTSALQITNLTLGDSGSYWCTAGNVAGEVDSPVTSVIVQRLNEHLSFDRTPRNQTVTSGDTATFSCGFNRKPEDSGWLFNSISVKIKTTPKKYTILETGDLVIASLDRNDSGKYICYGRDEDNNIYTHAYLSVNYFDVSEAIGPDEGTALVGDSYTVRCTAPLSHPRAQVTMLKGETELVSGPGYTVQNVETQYFYVIENVTHDDAGDYACQATNQAMVDGSHPFDPWTSRRATLTVKDSGVKPEQFSSRRSTSVGPGSSVEVECSAIADPEPTVEWYKESGGRVEEVVENDRTRFSAESAGQRYNYSLTLDNVTLEDHNVKYFCTLTNKLGSTNSPKTTVYVNHITCQNSKLLQTKTFDVQQPAKMACPKSLSAHPREQITWSYNQSTSSLHDEGNDLYTDSLVGTDDGTYKCFVKNSAGNCSYTIQLKAEDSRAVTDGSNKMLVFIVAGLAFIVLLVVMFVALLQIRKRVKKKKIESNEALERLNQPVFSASANGYEDGPGHALLPSPTSNMTHNQLYSTLSKFSSWQIAKSRLRNFSPLGEGQFGSVYRAELRSLDGSPSNLVAIKQIKDDNNPEAILEYEKEMLMMTQLHHPNIVKLIGLCTDMAPYYIITEYMEKGNLASFLQEIAQSKSERLSLVEQVHMSVQVASGLRYMADKNFVHRDVAARNCLVGPGLTVKVADFGLSRSLSGREIYQKDGGTVPIRWMSPEAIQYGQYTSANDVWAYGITVWEVFSYGVIPYSAWSNEDVAANVQAGSRLIRPDMCPQSIYNIMSHCWAEHPDYRPTFLQIIESLNAL